MPDWFAALDWIGLATLGTIVIGLYKLFQEAKAAKATADTAASNAEIAALNAKIAANHAEQTLLSITKVAGSVAEIVTNTNGMQKHIEALVRKEEQGKADMRVAEARGGPVRPAGGSKEEEEPRS